MDNKDKMVILMTNLLEEMANNSSTDFEEALMLFDFKRQLGPQRYDPEKLLPLVRRIGGTFIDNDDASFTRTDLIDALIYTSKVEFSSDFYLNLDEDTFIKRLYSEPLSLYYKRQMRGCHIQIITVFFNAAPVRS